MKTQKEIQIMLALEQARLKKSTNILEQKIFENRISILKWVLGQF